MVALWKYENLTKKQKKERKEPAVTTPGDTFLFPPIIHYKGNAAAAFVLASVAINRAFKCT